MTAVPYDVVVPTIGRRSLRTLLDGLAAQPCPGLDRLVLVDDRPAAVAAGEPLDVPAGLAGRVTVLRSRGNGPAAARNRGWRRGSAPWVVFLDDDVEPAPSWAGDLQADLAAAGPPVGAVQGRVRVPRPADRRPTDWERDVAGLETSAWITADLAYRRVALEQVDGFDGGFPRAYREDADLALRVAAAGWTLTRGRRTVVHPVRDAPWWISVARQRGNADDVRMRALHGDDWRVRADAPRGRLRNHLVATALAGTGVLAAVTGHRRVALAAGAGWATATAGFAARRIAPGPRTPAEVAAMVATSVAIPPAACWYRLRGELAVRRAGVRPVAPVSAGAGAGERATVAPRPPAPTGGRPRAGGRPTRPPVAAVLFDRDGTLVVDVPYNGDPDLVVPAPGAAQAVALCRAARLRVGVVSNQSGVARGLLSEDDVRAVNARVDELVGPLDVWVHCPHDDAAGCECRKPAPGMVREAARRLGVEPAACVVIGDIGADVAAAAAAGARGILVPTPATRRDEVEAADEVAPSLLAAVHRALEGGAGPPDGARPGVLADVAP